MILSILPLLFWVGACVLLIVLAPFAACHLARRRYLARVAGEFADQPLQPEELLQAADIAHLPAVVRSYIIGTGALGKARVRNVCVKFAAQMWKKPNAGPMKASSEQYNFFAEPARLFFMRASVAGVPLRVFHAYGNHEATMQVQIAGLYKVVDVAGPELSATETVTLLNDMCCFAPATLIDPRLTWKEVDHRSVEVGFQNGPHSVTATLYFNDAGDLVEFSSTDRGALQDDGTFRKLKWSTPIGNYQTLRGRRIPTYGEAVYDSPEGAFAYGKFTLRDIEYNVPGSTAR